MSVLSSIYINKEDEISVWSTKTGASLSVSRTDGNKVLVKLQDLEIVVEYAEDGTPRIKTKNASSRHKSE